MVRVVKGLLFLMIQCLTRGIPIRWSLSAANTAAMHTVRSKELVLSIVYTSTRRRINFGSSIIGFMTQPEMGKANSIMSGRCCPTASARNRFSFLLFLWIPKYGKRYCCPLKSNRKVDDSGGSKTYRRVDSLTWTATEKKQGKLIKIRGFPREHKVKLFRVVLSTKHTEYLLTNDITLDNTRAVRKVSGFHWKIEQFHRETEQLTGLEGCQCRKARIVRNHIACAGLGMYSAQAAC